MKPSLILIGLGNPGKEYVGTRHNVGFWGVEYLAEKFGTAEWKPKQKFLADICEGRVVTVPVLLVKPATFMNRSGESIKKIVDFYQLDPAKQILIISDEIDLAPGDARYKEKGGAGTHNGLKSIVEQFGEDFPRIRIGVGKQKPSEDLSQYVLSRIPKEDYGEIEKAVTSLPELVREFTLGS
ncbi:MAG TPA: aminoacyl-tRNA hydrolase [Candidatus Peribacterales bacterium]|nr:aminoacyl-tRNA hydrolase [Candidatus Peribacterales bacterium]